MAIIKIIEVVSESEKSWENAAENALADASKTVQNITGIDVIGFKAQVENNKITKYKANCRIAFKIDNK